MMSTLQSRIARIEQSIANRQTSEVVVEVQEIIVVTREDVARVMARGLDDSPLPQTAGVRRLVIRPPVAAGDFLKRSKK